MTIDTTINKYSLTNQDVIAALRRCANDRSVCDECVFCSDNVKKWRYIMGIAADRLEKLTAGRDEYKRRAEAAEHDILDMIIEEGGNLDLCHWCGANCPDNDYSQCEQKIRWRGPCEENCDGGNYEIPEQARTRA